MIFVIIISLQWNDKPFLIDNVLLSYDFCIGWLYIEHHFRFWINADLIKSGLGQGVGRDYSSGQIIEKIGNITIRSGQNKFWDLNRK